MLDMPRKERSLAVFLILLSFPGQLVRPFVRHVFVFIIVSRFTPWGRYTSEVNHVNVQSRQQLGTELWRDILIH